jgi:hypothetical protein
VPASASVEKPRNGSVWLRRNLCQAAWAASHSKNTYLSAQFRRLAARKGKKRAIVAVGHTILVIVFHMLKNQQPYRDLGADYFDRRNAEQLKRSLVRKLERLGVQVSIVSNPRHLNQLETHIFDGEPQSLSLQFGNLELSGSSNGSSDITR